MYQQFYQEHFKLHQDKLFFQAHSHHPWPDASYEGQIQYWRDCQRLLDQKWTHLYQNVIPEVSSLIKSMLSLPLDHDLVFAPNTHELFYRLLSCYPANQKIRILTSSHEFHSFRRQISRLKQENLVEVTEVSYIENQYDCQLFLDSLIAHLQDQDFDVIFLSQCFFDLGIHLDESLFLQLQSLLKPHQILVIDAYHSFATRPLDFSFIKAQTFILAGGYKYAQAGEGVCFMSCSQNCQLEPRYTGWFADFTSLESTQNKIGYAPGALRFSGSTFDPTGLYRFKAVWNHFKNNQIDTNKIHRYIRELQEYFLALWMSKNLPKNLFLPIRNCSSAHFISLNLSTHQKAKEIYYQLLENNIFVDYRDKYLRIGFGMHLDKNNIKKLIDIFELIFS